MLRLQAILEHCGATITKPLTLDSKLSTLNLDSLGYLQLWTEIASEDFPINALFDADITEWNLRDVLYFSELRQGSSKQKLFQRRLQKSELPFVLSKCLECGSESGSAVVGLMKSLKKTWKHCVCEGFYMRDCKRNVFALARASELPSLPKGTRQRRASASYAHLQSAQGKAQCLGFFIAFVQPKNVYIPIIWIAKEHQNKAIPFLIWHNLAPLLNKRTLTAPLWARQHFARYVVSEQNGILTLDSEAIVQRFTKGRSR